MNHAPLFVGSANKKKLAELVEFFAGSRVRLLTPKDLPKELPAPVEDGATFEVNADKKALGYAELTGFLTLADDSGLEVDALSGRPGVHSARYAGEQASDAANNQKLLRELEGIPEGRRSARYVCVISVAQGGRVLIRSRGVCEGQILTIPSGQSGFGYDSLFYVPSLARTFAEIPLGEKQLISHRGKALSALRSELPALLNHLERP